MNGLKLVIRAAYIKTLFQKLFHVNREQLDRFENNRTLLD